MKLTRKQLIHARDVQLTAIGIRRKENHDWLQKALKTEFTQEQINAFETAQKVKYLAALKPETALSMETKRADTLGENCRWMVERFDEIHSLLCRGENGTWQQRIQQVVIAAHKLCAQPAPKLDSPEAYANELYEACVRDLS